jgi:hypothetical protein
MGGGVLSLPLLFFAGLVVGWQLQPRRLVAVTAIAGVIVGVMTAVTGWSNTGCSGECNDTTGNANLRAALGGVAGLVLVAVWALGVVGGRRTGRKG